MSEPKGIQITKPKSIWAKPVKLKLKLFKSLFNTFKDAILMNWVKIPSDVLDTISGFELKISIRPFLHENSYSRTSYRITFPLSFDQK